MRWHESNLQIRKMTQEKHVDHGGAENVNFQKPVKKIEFLMTRSSFFRCFS
jgi:hypothetical protein